MCVGVCRDNVRDRLFLIKSLRCKRSVQATPPQGVHAAALTHQQHACRPNLIKGFMQLYSVEQKRSQPLEAHAAAFSTLKIAGKETNIIVFTTKSFANGTMNSKVHCIALGGTHKKQAELFFPADLTDDFPVSLNVRYAPSLSMSPSTSSALDRSLCLSLSYNGGI